MFLCCGSCPCDESRRHGRWQKCEPVQKEQTGGGERGSTHIMYVFLGEKNEVVRKYDAASNAVHAY